MEWSCEYNGVNYWVKAEPVMELESGGISFTVHIGEDDTFPVIYGPALKDHNGQTLRCETESDAINIADQIQKVVIDSRSKSTEFFC